jgi:sugar lactone lactonase YvrE
VKRRFALLALVLAAPAQAAEPLPFAWPTGVEVTGEHMLIVVENGTGRVDRVDAATGRSIVLATIDRAYRTAASSGALFVSAHGGVWRIGPRGALRKLVAIDDAGPIAVTASGDVFFTTDTGLYRLSAGKGPARLVRGTSELGGAHGLAAATGGTLLVSDTRHGRVVRLDPATGRMTTLQRLADPRGIAAAKDGSIYVVAGAAKRVLHLDAHGARVGYVGNGFGDPYDLALAADGSIYVVDTAEIGTVSRIAPGGTTKAVVG